MSVVNNKLTDRLCAFNITHLIFIDFIKNIEKTCIYIYIYIIFKFLRYFIFLILSHFCVNLKTKFNRQIGIPFYRKVINQHAFARYFTIFISNLIYLKNKKTFILTMNFEAEK